jgi:glutamate formiminotransferase/formiminotetrahydrofolate cyclodeaminase
MKIVECIPNFSEGRRPEVVKAIVDAVAAVEGVRILDYSSDHDHNRTVLTFVGDPKAVEEGAFACISKAAELIDLNTHHGEHPRMGATDVVPFVPISDVTMADCIEMARRLGKRVAGELNIPVYFYEEAAIRKDRVNLEDIRRGEFEGIKETIAIDPYKEPDLGPKVMGPAGATVIGARQPLIAYNIFLNTDDVSIAQKIARRTRHSNGGFRFVKGIGLLVDGLAQVSMNLTDYRRSPIAQVTEFVRREAQRYGVGIHHTEIIGLIPMRAMVNAGKWYMQMDGLQDEQILENQVFGSQSGESAGENIYGFLDEVAAGTPAPGGGSSAAYAGALGAALTLMNARLTVGKKRYVDVEHEVFEVIEQAEPLRQALTEGIEKDAKSYDGVVEAMRLPKGTEEEIAARDEAILKASLGAAQVPLQTARDCLAALKLANRMCEIGNENAISDAAAGAHMAKAGFMAAGLNVRINLLGYDDNKDAQALKAEWDEMAKEVDALMNAMSATVYDRMGI